MMKLSRTTFAVLSACAFTGAGAAAATDPSTIDWTQISAVGVPLFYPGASSCECCAVTNTRVQPRRLDASTPAGLVTMMAMKRNWAKSR